MVKVGVVGTTSWGTTLAIILARQGVDVTILARTEDEAARLNAQGENERFVPGVMFPSGVRVTAYADEAFSGAKLALIVVPSRTFRENVQKMAGSLEDATVVISATKGLEIGTGRRMSEILEEELPNSSICALSGPNLAREIIQGKPSSTVIASGNHDAAREAQSIINSSRFRVYTNDDITGVELGGPRINNKALGAGICDGLDYGDNAKAAFITRGLAEMSRLAAAAGANPLTLAGLAGMGDLIATCSSTLSRNHYVGEQLARGKSLPEIRATMKNVVEGVDTTPAAITLADRLDVEMPITQAAYNVLFNDVPVKQAVSDLLERAPRPERAG